MSQSGEPPTSSWLPGIIFGIVGVIGGIWSWILNWRIKSAKEEGKTEVERERLEDRDDGFREDIRALRDELKDGISELRAVAAATARLQGSQDVVNAVTAKAIESISLKMEAHAEKLANHEADIRLITRLLTSQKEA